MGPPYTSQSCQTLCTRESASTPSANDTAPASITRRTEPRSTSHPTTGPPRIPTAVSTDIETMTCVRGAPRSSSSALISGPKE